MKLSKAQQVRLLVALLAVLIALSVYRAATEAPQRTAPLAFTRGMTTASAVRMGIPAAGGGADPINVLLARRMASFPGVSRDLFHMSGAGAVGKPRKPKHAPQPVVVTQPTPTVPVKSAEEIAADAARADLSKFRFLGYLTDAEKDKNSSLFLSKDGELFIAKSGDTLLMNYRIKSAEKDYVVLQDTVTKVEVRIELSGSGK